MGRRCCCGCWRFQDNFNRASSTDVGSSWNEQTGNWEITLDTLLHECVGGGGTGSAKLIGTKPEPASSAGEQSLDIDVLEPTTGDIFYLYPCCTDNSTIGPVACSYEYLGSNSWETKINGAHAVTQLASNLGSAEHPRFGLWCCADHQTAMVEAGVESVADEYSWSDNDDPGDGLYYGIGHNNSTTGGTFDDFSVWELRDGIKNCVDCWCWCWDVVLDKHLTATITAASDRALCLGGLTWAMDWEWDDPYGIWKGTLTVTRDSDPAKTEVIPFILYCEHNEDDHDPDYAGKNWWLTFAFPYTVCADDGYGPFRATTGSTCTPLSLVFGPFTIHKTNLACHLCYDPFPAAGPDSGTYYIVITD